MSTNPGRIDKYELRERLGQSSMSEVWKAFDTQAQRYIAIKFLHPNLPADPDFVTRFTREAQIITSLHHPNIVQYYGFSTTQLPGAASATPYLVMDYVESGNLASYMSNTSRERKLLPIGDIVRLFTSIGMAVDYAYQHSVVHGNIKPANILLDKRHTSRNAMGEPVVTDFGVAGLLRVTAGSASGWGNNTPLYISPEQIMGYTGNERSDIYSLGIILYEICTGTLPFLGSNPAAIMMQHVNTIPASPMLVNPNLPPAVAMVIMRSIAKDPSARFPDAASLVAALADAAKQGEQPHPLAPSPLRGEGRGEAAQPAYPVNPMDMPTVLSTRQSPLQAGMTPSAPAPSSPGISGVSFSSPTAPAEIPGGGALATPSYYMASSRDAFGASSPERSTPDMSLAGSSQPYPAVRPGGPITPMLPASTPGYPAQNFPAAAPSQPPASKKPGRRGLWIGLAVLLILALIGSSLGAYFAFFSKSNSPATPQVVGHAYFVSSGLLSPNSRQGIADQLQISLQNVPPPQAGKSYYAWLLNDITLDYKPIFLGTLTFNNGTLNLSYPGDTLHSNLLAANSRFLITEQDAAVTPTNPSLDPATWLYYAEFSQKKANPADPKSFSLYDHVRHLLADDPKVKAAGLTGGLDIWLYRNTQKILEWAGSARDSWKVKNTSSSAFIHRQLTRIMDYLDGSLYVQKDLPSENVLADPAISKVGLLTFNPQTQDPPGYVYHIGKHLHELSVLPASTAEQRALAIQINKALDVVNRWLQTIHDEVMQLYSMTDAQLFGNNGLSLLDSVATLANDVFVGQVNPHAQVTDGVVQIHYNIQRLATFEIRACTASDSCAL
jgi:eukaryotic-like serine/threonine-protein kinase